MKIRLLKNRTGYSVALNILRSREAVTASYKQVEPVLYMLPGECIDIKDILISDPNISGYNEDILRNYVRRNILTELLLEVTPQDSTMNNYMTFSWKMSSPLNTKRSMHTAEILESGRVLVVGGYDGINVLNSTEVFDPITNEWIPGPSLAKPRFAHSTIKLKNEDVLIIGGYNPDDLGLSSVEKFPSYYGIINYFNGSSAFTTTVQPLSVPRIWPASILLDDGRVLVTGGYNSTGVLNTCEIYNPESNLWSSTSAMNSHRTFHSATKLKNGSILVTGGYDGNNRLASCEIFNPNTETWTPVMSLHESREDHLSFLLDTGEVLVVGGSTTVNNSPTKLGSAEVYDADHDIWSVVGSLPIPANGLAGVLLANGKPLITGGESIQLDTLKLSVIFNSDIFKSTANSLVEPRQNHTLTKLKDGRVIAVGGNTFDDFNETSEIFSKIPGLQ